MEMFPFTKDIIDSISSTHRKIDFERIYQELKQSVINSETIGAETKAISPVAYVKEFRTIGIQAPRQTGKTTFILKKVIEEKGIIVVGHISEKVRLKPKLPDEGENLVFTLEEIFNSKNIEIPKVKHIFVERNGVNNEHWLAVAMTEIMGPDIIITYIGT